MSNTAELIKVTQLPEIRQMLEEKSKEVSAKVADAKSLVCTEDTIQIVKKTRANLNKELAEIEAQRKNVKDAIMKPYNDFEALYKEMITNKYKEADKELKEKIDSVEGTIKGEMEEEIKGYFAEYAESLYLPWVTFDMMNLNITLSATKKKLKENVRSFLDNILNGVLLIETQENADEIMVEFKKSLDASQSIRTVVERKKAIVESEERRKAFNEARAQEIQAEKEVEAFMPPSQIEELPIERVKEEEITITFKVTDTKERLIVLRNFLKEEGYKYE